MFIISLQFILNFGYYISISPLTTHPFHYRAKCNRLRAAIPRWAFSSFRSARSEKGAFDFALKTDPPIVTPLQGNWISSDNNLVDLCPLRVSLFVKVWTMHNTSLEEYTYIYRGMRDSFVSSRKLCEISVLSVRRVSSVLYCILYK